jgi:hypothetical protein
MCSFLHWLSDHDDPNLNCPTVFTLLRHEFDLFLLIKLQRVCFGIHVAHLRQWRCLRNTLECSIRFYILATSNCFLHHRHRFTFYVFYQSINMWGSHSDHYEECRLLGYKNPLLTSQETHYLYATESSRLILSKIWGLRGGDYEECRLLGYKNPFRTSQETHYVSTTE